MEVTVGRQTGANSPTRANSPTGANSRGLGNPPNSGTQSPGAHNSQNTEAVENLNEIVLLMETDLRTLQEENNQLRGQLDQVNWDQTVRMAAESSANESRAQAAQNRAPVAAPAQLQMQDSPTAARNQGNGARNQGNGDNVGPCCVCVVSVIAAGYIGYAMGKSAGYNDGRDQGFLKGYAEGHSDGQIKAFHVMDKYCIDKDKGV